MSDTVIQVDRLWKKYRLGVLGTGTLRHDLNRWWHRVRGKEDPYSKIGSEGGNLKPEVAKAASPLSPQVSSLIPLSPLRDDEIWALRDISFEVRQGEILGIIGRNGAGKSTLLKILSRVTAPTAGEIRVKGRIASLLEVGTGFHPELTGRENIFLNGAILGMTKNEVRRKLDEIVAFAEIEKFLDTPVKRYSSGMYVRLAFAVAAHLDPEILIVDEVLAVGDAQFQKKCLGKMGDVAKGGRTVLFVSHSMEAVQSLCCRALLLSEGCLVEEGPVTEVVSRYTESQQKEMHGGGVLEGKHASITLQVQDADRKPITSVSAGAPFRILLTITCKHPIMNARIGIGIKSLWGQRVTTLHTHFQRAEPFSIEKNTICEVEVLESRLCPGDYIFEVAIYDAGNLLSVWEFAGGLSVHARDFFRTGKLPDPRTQGCMLTPAKWQIYLEDKS